jgi:hypothetical protein
MWIKEKNMNQLFENWQEFAEEEINTEINTKNEKKNHWKLFNDILENIRLFQTNFYEELEKEIGEQELAEFWKKNSFLILKNISSCIKETINFEEAKKQGRKKGDGKGKWPTTIDNIEKVTSAYVYVVNDIVNRNFWALVNFPKIQYKLFCIVSYTIALKFNEYMTGEEKFLPIFSKKTKRKMNKEDKINYFIENKFPELKKEEKSILEKILKNSVELRKMIEEYIEQENA